MRYQMSDLERHIRENWSYMCPAERPARIDGFGSRKRT